MDEIKTAYPDTRTLVGKTIYVKASVLTQTGRESSDESVMTRCSQLTSQASPKNQSMASSLRADHQSIK